MESVCGGWECGGVEGVRNQPENPPICRSVLPSRFVELYPFDVLLSAGLCAFCFFSLLFRVGEWDIGRLIIMRDIVHHNTFGFNIKSCLRRIIVVL